MCAIGKFIFVHYSSQIVIIKLFLFFEIFRESEDTTLFIIKEIYSSQGIRTDNQIPQPTMTIERSISRNDSPTPF